MILFMYLAGIIFVILFLGYQYLNNRQRRENIEKKISSTEKKLSQLKESQRDSAHEVERLQHKLRLATEDAVTKTLSWQIFEERLTQSIQAGEQFNFTLGLLLIDIDDFNVIQDALGYLVADALLLEVAQRLQTCTRKVDSISRFGKDRFAILLPQLTKPETAAMVAQRLLQIFTEAFTPNGQELFATASIGIAIYPTDAKEASSLLRNAETALQTAKLKGKQTYQFYQEKTYVNSRRELALYNNLRRATVYNELFVQYQPIMDIRESQVFCVDAFLYWQHTELGRVEPSEIQEYAEKQHMENQLFEWLLRQATQQFLLWRRAGFTPKYLGLSVSIKQLEQNQLVFQLSKILQEIGFEPKNLLLEIKNHPSSESLPELKKSFNMLSYLGVKIAISNFGGDAISLSFLRHLTIHYVKLDPSLIEDIERNARTQSLIRAVQFLAKNLTSEVIAQGVHTAAQRELLAEMNCDYMQGNLFAKPQLAVEMLPMYAAVD